MAGIGEQLEVQAFLGAEALVRVHVVHTDAHDHGVLRRVFIDIALEVVCFDRAALREVLGIEIEHHPLALELIERHLRPFLAGQAESRGLRPRGWGLRLIRSNGGKHSQGQSQKKYRVSLHKTLLQNFRHFPGLRINDNHRALASCCTRFELARKHAYVNK